MSLWDFIPCTAPVFQWITQRWVQCAHYPLTLYTPTHPHTHTNSSIIKNQMQGNKVPSGILKGHIVWRGIISNHLTFTLNPCPHAQTEVSYAGERRIKFAIIR